jgi:hypothetical protein
MVSADLIDDDQRRVIAPVREEHRAVEAEANLVVAMRAAEKVAPQGGVLLPRDFVKADRARRNVAEATVRTDSRQHRSGNVTAPLARFPERLVSFRQLNPVCMAPLAQNPPHRFGVVGGELKVRPPLPVAVSSV